METITLQAKEGNADAVLEILEIYKPLLIKNAIVNGRLMKICIRTGKYIASVYPEIPDN